MKNIGNVIKSEINENDYMPTIEVCKILKVSQPAISRWTKTGISGIGKPIHWYKYKGKMYFLKSDIEELKKYY